MEPPTDQLQPDAIILVAEDDALIRLSIVDTLADAGLQVIEAFNGGQALRLLEIHHAVKLVVTDINMPGADGIDVALRARERHPEVKVLFVTARPDLLRSVRTPRPHSYLTKPFEMSDLLARVMGLLAGTQS